jgi:hypothetical protein
MSERATGGDAVELLELPNFGKAALLLARPDALEIDAPSNTPPVASGVSVTERNSRPRQVGQVGVERVSVRDKMTTHTLPLLNWPACSRGKSRWPKENASMQRYAARPQCQAAPSAKAVPYEAEAD